MIVAAAGTVVPPGNGGERVVFGRRLVIAREITLERLAHELCLRTPPRA